MKTNRLKGVAGNCSEVICVNVQGVNCSETLKSNWKRPCWTTQVTDYKYVEKVFTNLSHKLNRSENDEMFDFKTNGITWGLFVSTTMKSAVHLGREYQHILTARRNTNFEEIKTLFDITLRLIVENSFGNLNLSTMICDFSPWMSATLCHDQVIKWTKAKKLVFSDSVLVLG